MQSHAAERALAIKRRTETVTRQLEGVAKRKTAKVSRHDVLTLKSIFDEIDADGNGHVTLGELHAKLSRRRAEAMRYDGTAWSAQRRRSARDSEQSGLHIFADSLLKAMDRGGANKVGGSDGTVEFEEMLRVLYPLCTEEEHAVMLGYVRPVAPASPQAKQQQPADALSASQREEITSIFRLFDGDGSGGLSRAEWAAATERCGLSPAEAQHLFEAVASGTDAGGEGEAERAIRPGDFVALMAESAGHWRAPEWYGGLRALSSSPQSRARRRRLRGEARVRTADALPPLAPWRAPISPRALASSVPASAKAGRAFERRLDASLRRGIVRFSPSAAKYSIRTPAQAVLWAHPRDGRADEERALRRVVAQAAAF